MLNIKQGGGQYGRRVPYVSLLSTLTAVHLISLRDNNRTNGLILSFPNKKGRKGGGGVKRKIRVCFSGMFLLAISLVPTGKYITQTAFLEGRLMR